MPTGFVFEGGIFESTNMPTQTQNATIAGAPRLQRRTGITSSCQLVGIGGNNAQVLLNNNDDFSDSS